MCLKCGQLENQPAGLTHRWAWVGCVIWRRDGSTDFCNDKNTKARFGEANLLMPCPEEMRKPIDAGMAVADETLRAGQAALKEKDFRRLGLAISALFIAITLAAIWLVIRRIEADGSGYVEGTGQK